MCYSLPSLWLNVVQADADVFEKGQCVDYKEILHCHAKKQATYINLVVATVLTHVVITVQF